MADFQTIMLSNEKCWLKNQDNFQDLGKTIKLEFYIAIILLSLSPQLIFSIILYKNNANILEGLLMAN
jgi:hypothetical protein